MTTGIKILIDYFIIGFLLSFVIVPVISRLTGYKEKWYNFESEEDIRLFFSLLFIWPIMLCYFVVWLCYEAIPKAIADFFWRKHRNIRNKKG